MGEAVLDRVTVEVPFFAVINITKSYEPQTGDWIIEGYAATTDLDLQDDRIEQRALEDAAPDLEKNSTMLLNHDPKIPIGRILKTWLDARGLGIRALISKTVPDIWKKIQEGVLNKFSIRGSVLDYIREFDEKLGRIIRVIRKMYLFEASVVSVPGNPEAEALGCYIAKALQEVEQKMAEKKEGDGDPALNAGGGAKDKKEPQNLDALTATVKQLSEAMTGLQKKFEESIQKGPIADLMKILESIRAAVKGGEGEKLVDQAKEIASKLTYPGAYPGPDAEKKKTEETKKSAEQEEFAKTLEGLGEAVKAIAGEVGKIRHNAGMPVFFRKSLVGSGGNEKADKKDESLRGRLESAVEGLLSGGRA